MHILETKRLLLRPFYHTDLDDVYEYSKNENVGPNAGWPPHRSKQESWETMQDVFLDKEDIWAIEIKELCKVIGSIGIIDDPKRQNPKTKMLGYSIGEPYWGLGYMTEAVERVLAYAFLEKNSSLVSAYCYPFNHRSQRVLEKNKFQYEGLLRQAEKMYHGEVFDNLCFSVTKEEYLSL